MIVARSVNNVNDNYFVVIKNPINNYDGRLISMVDILGKKAGLTRLNNGLVILEPAL